MIEIGAEGEEFLVREGQMDPSETDELITSEFPVNDPVSAKQLKVYLDITRVSGWNEIDPVQMVGGDGKKHWVSGSSDSSRFAD